jgi:hypothetical protein
VRSRQRSESDRNRAGHQQDDRGQECQRTGGSKFHELIVGLVRSNTAGKLNEKVVPSLITKAGGAAALMLFLVACSSGPPKLPVIGEAYVGPAVLKIRKDIPLDSGTAATVRHGERVEIVQRRRRFLRVRTSGGAEGWTEERQLLNTAELESLKDLSERAAKLPSQGLGVPFNGDLNVHTQPDRLSPSFLLIKEKEKVDVLAHVMLPRVQSQRPPLLPPPPKKSRLQKKPAKEPKYPPPPMPKAPAPPANWLDLSKTAPDPEAPPPEEPETAPVPIESWSMVRTKAGQSGWVLTRRLQMAIPDDVAQYAEGRRIISYFPLAVTQDGDQKKETWLWTTSGSGPQPYDFDSFRVFVWSIRRHRYETAYIDRNVRGHSPVLLKEVDLSPGAARGVAAGKYPGFSICVENDQGQVYRREFALISNIVRFAGERPCQPPEPLIAGATPPKAAAPALESPPAPQPRGSLWQRFRKRVRALTPHWLGG